MTWYLFPKSTQNITKGLIIVWHAGYSSWSIHYFKADTLHSPTIHLYQTALVKSCSLVKIKIPYPAPFPSRSSHLFIEIPDSWFSAPIPNIATKISQIPHPAKPIVDPHVRGKHVDHNCDNVAKLYLKNIPLSCPMFIILCIKSNERQPSDYGTKSSLLFAGTSKASSGGEARSKPTPLMWSTQTARQQRWGKV